MVWSEKRYCQKIWRTSIDALNDLHSRHGHDEVSKCTVCVSKTAESTIAKHFQPYQDRIAELEAAQEGKVLVPTKITELLQEVIGQHCDPDDHFYNECETPDTECMWCFEAKKVIAAAQTVEGDSDGISE